MQKQDVKYDSFEEVDFTNEINERDNQIKDLHDNMKEVNELFNEIHLLVNTQQDSVDNIQIQVEKTSQNIALAIEELNKANDYQQTTSCVII